MNANEIHAGKDYILKIAHNNIKVKVLSHTGHSWIVKTAGGKIMPIQMADRFVRPVDHVPDPVTIPIPTEPQTPASETAAEPATPTAPVPPTIPVAPVISEESVPFKPVSTPTEKKLSMLDAAAQVLKDAGHPMKINDILEAMQTSGIWTPGTGKTPLNSLVAGLGLEIRRRVKNRFHKTAPGTFEYIG